jgi:hypothetical protein
VQQRYWCWSVVALRLVFHHSPPAWNFLPWCPAVLTLWDPIRQNKYRLQAFLLQDEALLCVKRHNATITLEIELGKKVQRGFFHKLPTFFYFYLFLPWDTASKNTLMVILGLVGENSTMYMLLCC